MVKLTPGDAFRRGLLLALCWEEDQDWTDLILALNRSIEIMRERLDDPQFDLSSSTKKKIRQTMMSEGIVEQRRMRNHYQLRITDSGWGLVEEFIDDDEELEKPRDPDDVVPIPEIPFRSGAGHLLPYMTFKALNAQIKGGKVDVIFIPSKTKTKTGYWDEADA